MYDMEALWRSCGYGLPTKVTTCQSGYSSNDTKSIRSDLTASLTPDDGNQQRRNRPTWPWGIWPEGGERAPV